MPISGTCFNQSVKNASCAIFCDHSSNMLSDAKKPAFWKDLVGEWELARSEISFTLTLSRRIPPNPLYVVTKEFTCADEGD